MKVIGTTVHTVDGEQYITITQACAIFMVSRRTLYNWMDGGKVPFVYAPGGGRLLALSALNLRRPNGEPVEIDVPATLATADPETYDLLGLSR